MSGKKTLRESCGCTAIKLCGQRIHILIHYNYSTDLMSRLTNVIFNLDGWLNSPRLQMNLSPQTQPMEVKIHTTHTYRNPVNSECLFQST